MHWRREEGKSCWYHFLPNTKQCEGRGHQLGEERGNQVQALDLKSSTDFAQVNPSPSCSPTTTRPTVIYTEWTAGSKLAKKLTAFLHPSPVSGSIGGAGLHLLGSRTQRPAQEFVWELRAGPTAARLNARQKPKALCVGQSWETELLELPWLQVENCTPVRRLEFLHELLPVLPWTFGILHSNRLLMSL